MSAKKSPLTAAVLPGTALKAKSPYLDLQQLPANSIVKPSLRKSLGGAASRGRTPFDALKSPGGCFLSAMALICRVLLLNGVVEILLQA